MKLVFMGSPLLAVKVLEALVKDGHDIAGVYTSSSQEYYDSHEKFRTGLDFIKWYDIIMKDCPKTTEVIWHTL